MPLQKILFKPGVNKENTRYTTEGGWYEADKVRFRQGNPEVVGGWQPFSTYTYQGVCRSLWNWVTLNGDNLIGVGTNLKFYIQNGTGGSFYDITPIRSTTAAGDVTFAATNGSTTLTVTDAAHGAQAGDFVTYSGAVSLGGVITATVLNAEYQVVAVTSNNVYTITSTVAANASDVGNGGSATVGTYQITTGSDVFTVNVGWGAGGWGGITTGYTSTGWGSPAPAGVGLGSQLRLWSQANFGEDLIFNPRGGGLYLWEVNANPNIFDRGTLLTTGDTPDICNFVMVSDSSRFVLCFGVNDYGSAVQNPMLVRWSDQEDYTQWTPAITNQAGSFTLSEGSAIITASQSRQEILVWTDSALYSMQYLGPPYVWGFQILSDNLSIVSPNATATVNNVTYWMGIDKFYMYSGRAETLYCPIRQYIFNDINISQAFQFFSGTNEGYNEVWWFYCSSGSTDIDRYVIYNHLEKIWSYGNLGRTAWLDSPLRDSPMATGYNGQLIYHESGVDDGTTNPPTAITSFCQSADINIGDGHNYGFGYRMIPDVTFNGSTVNNPAVTFTLRPRQNPGSNYSASATPAVTSTQNYQSTRNYEVQQFTEIVYVRVRGRQMAFRISSSTLGVQWQLGVPSIDIRPDGRR